MRYLFTILTILAIGCAHGPKSTGAKAVVEIYGKAYEGVRAAPPDLKDSDERLDIFLGVTTEDTERAAPWIGPETIAFDDVIYCIAFNEEEEPLPEVEELINATPTDKPIYLWGKAVTEKMDFWWQGVDCIAEVIAVWHPKARDYVYIDLTHKISVWKSLSIKGALRDLVKQSGKAARKAVVP